MSGVWEPIRIVVAYTAYTYTSHIDYNVVTVTGQPTLFPLYVNTSIE